MYTHRKTLLSVVSHHLRSTATHTIHQGSCTDGSDTTLANDHTAFVADGSRIKQVKFFNNVIREPLFDISLVQAWKQS